MGTLTNSPRQQTTLRLEARKSFALGLWIQDQSGRPLDITDTTIRLVMRKPPLPNVGDDDSDNLIDSDDALLVAPEEGYARLTLQAYDLNHKPREYPFAIVMWADGYSVVLVQGVIDLLENTEYSSVGESYVGENAATSLTVQLQNKHSINVQTGPSLAPGTTSFTDGDKAKLDGIEAGANNTPNNRLVPVGGHPGEVLVKLSSSTGDTAWAVVSGGGSGGDLDATGVEAGQVPTANGVGSWSWDEIPAKVISVNGKQGIVSITLADIPDGGDRYAISSTERLKLANLTLTPDWDDIQEKPSFGSASLRDEDDFLQPEHVDGTDITTGTVVAARLPKVTQHRGFSWGTAAPSGGEDGDMYFQYTP